MKRVSIIIPMFNEARHIERTLTAVRRAAERAEVEYELIVLDNGSSDDGPERARQQGAQLLSYPGLTIGALRNRGVEQATGDILAFIDADIEMPETWLSTCREWFEQHQAGLIALSLQVPDHAPWYARAWQERNRPTHVAQRRVDWIPTTNICLPRDWFEKVGRFDEKLRTGEDKEFGLRLKAAGAQQYCLTLPVAVNWGYEGSWQEWVGKELWRQSSNVQLLRQDHQLRILRFPLLSAVCWVLTVYGVASLLTGALLAALLTLGISLALALLLSLRQTRHHRRLQLTLRLWPLHWLRLHLAAIALAMGLIRYQARRPARA